MSYLRITNWEHYQNADIFKKTKGKPPWVKLYTATLDDLELLALPPATQLLFDRLLLLAAKTANAIPSDPEWIANRVGIDCKLVVKGCEELRKGAWLSRTKSTRRSRKDRESFSPRSKKLEEEVPPKAPLRGKNDFNCSHCPGGKVFSSQRRLDEHLDVVHGIEPAPVVQLRSEAS